MVAIFADPSTDANYWARFIMQFFIILVVVRFMGWILGLIKQPSVIEIYSFEEKKGVFIVKYYLGYW